MPWCNCSIRIFLSGNKLEFNSEKNRTKMLFYGFCFEAETIKREIYVDSIFNTSELTSLKNYPLIPHHWDRKTSIISDVIKIFVRLSGLDWLTIWVVKIKIKSSLELTFSLPEILSLNGMCAAERNEINELSSISSAFKQWFSFGKIRETPTS